MYSGVFHIGHYVIGPLGLIKSKILRRNNLTLDVDWHCSTPTCWSDHSARLGQPADSIGKLLVAWPQIIKASRIMGEVKSQWHQFLKGYLAASKQDKLRKMLEHGYLDENQKEIEIKRQDYPYEMAPVLLTTCFSEKEAAQVLVDLISRNRTPVNEALNEGQITEFQCSSEDLLSIRFDKLFQVSMLYSNKDIIYSICSCIDSGAIKISNTEIRSIQSEMIGSFKLTYPKKLITDRTNRSRTMTPLFSRQGFTLVNRSYITGTLRRVVEKIVAIEKHADSLEFKLETYPGETIFQRVESMLINEKIETIVDNIFFHNKQILRDAIQFLPVGTYPSLDRPLNTDERKNLKEKILWRLGYNYTLPDDDYSLYKNMHTEYLDVLSNLRETDLDYKNKVRGVSSPFWSAVEQLLHSSMMFVTWALTSDHFFDTKFRYSPVKGRQSCVDVYDDFDPNEVNNLFFIVHSFSKLSKYLGSLKSSLRPDYQRPHWDINDSWAKFAFPNKKLYFDLSNKSKKDILEDLKSFSQELESLKIFYFRNSTTAHKENLKDPFPSIEEIKEFLTALDSLFEKILEKGILTSKFKVTDYSFQPEKGIHMVEVRDKNGQSINYQIDPLFWAVHNYPKLDIQSDFAYNFLQGYRFNVGLSPIYFLSIEQSEFMDYWKNYPIRVERG